MRIHRLLSLTDLVVFGVVAVAIFLPKRPLYAIDAYKVDADERAALAAAEAVAFARPDDGAAAAERARLLARAGQTDWAVEVARAGAARATEPTRWRPLLAASQAHADRTELVLAHEQAEAALEACRAAGEACPTWDELKLSLWVRYLDAGVKSGIDPRSNPRQFREKANRGLHEVGIER